jgi:hypothetical protein
MRVLQPQLDEPEGEDGPRNLDFSTPIGGDSAELVSPSTTSFSNLRAAGVRGCHEHGDLLNPFYIGDV